MSQTTASTIALPHSSVEAGSSTGRAFKMGLALGAYVGGRVLGQAGDRAEASVFSLAHHGPVKALAWANAPAYRLRSKRPQA